MIMENIKSWEQFNENIESFSNQDKIDFIETCLDKNIYVNAFYDKLDKEEIKFLEDVDFEDLSEEDKENLTEIFDKVTTGHMSANPFKKGSPTYNSFYKNK